MRGKKPVNVHSAKIAVVNFYFSRVLQNIVQQVNIDDRSENFFNHTLQSGCSWTLFKNQDSSKDSSFLCKLARGCKHAIHYF